MEIKSTGAPVIDEEGKKWMPVLLSFDAIAQFNKTALGDQPDEGTHSAEMREQVHKDCLQLIKEFKL